MRYVSNDREIRIGDVVCADGANGVVICDFDRWECRNGYESWLTKEKLADGSYFSSGVLIETTSLGVLHYAEPDEAIVFISDGQTS